MPGTVLITGAGRGLGLSMSKKFLERHDFLIALNKSESPEFSNLAAMHKDRIISFTADVSDEDSVKKTADELGKRSDFIDIIINNAGVHPEPAAHRWKHIDDLSDVSIGTLRDNIAVNSFGPLLVVKHFLHFLKNGNKKLIINISSEAGSISESFRKDELGYCMSKAALNMQSKILQNRLSEFGIKIIAVHPGWLKTGMGGEEAPDSPDEAAGLIVALSDKKWDLNGPIYMDSAGKAMNW